MLYPLGRCIRHAQVFNTALPQAASGCINLVIFILKSKCTLQQCKAGSLQRGNPSTRSICSRAHQRRCPQLMNATT